MRQHNLKVTGSLQINGESVVSASQIVGLESASIHNGNWTASVENNEFKVVNGGSNLLYITSGSTEINNGTVTITADSFASDYAEDYTELGDALLLKGNGVVSGSFRPATGGIHNLGTLEHPWKELFVSTGSINLVENGTVAFTITADTIVTTDTLTDGNIDLTNSLPVGVVSGSSQIIDILSSLNAYTGSNDTTNTNQNNRLDTIESVTGSYSKLNDGNTFTGTQIISGSTYVVGDFTVYGTSSITNISASVVSIGTNQVVLNTNYPSVRFAGISVRDSGSITNATGSLWWDSLNNGWVYQKESGSSYSGGMLISGPRNLGNLGDEIGITTNYLTKGQGGDHITSSAIIENGSGSIFYTNALFVSSSGIVGVGTTNPAYKLDVNGNGRFSSQLNVTSTLNILKTDFSTTGGQLAYDSNVNQLYLWNSISSGYFSIYTNSAERLTITSGGNIGIGISNPLSKLDISTSTSQALCIGNNSDTITSGDLIGAISFVSRDASTYSSGGITNIRSYATSTYNTGNVSGDLRFYVSNGLQNTTAAALFGTEAMRITNEGKVGIGTTNPGYRLTVVSDSTAALLVQSSNATVGSPILDFYDNGRSQETVITSTDNTTTGTYIASYSNHPLMFGANAGASPTAKMVIATNGNVGMGTNNPTSLLHIGTSTSGNSKLTHWGEPGFTANYGLILRGDSSDGVFKFYGLNNGSETGVPIFSMNRASANSTFGGSYISTYSRLNVEGSTKINRSKYNWYQGYWTGNGTYWHMKTNMSAGLGGNTQYTMSLFKGYFYAYSSPPALEGTYVFHNWDGSFYNTGSTGNLFVTAYRSSDGYVVLVTYSGSGEAGLTLDWHQAYAYPFVEAQVTAAGLHGSTTGKY